jgi:hypothetical protein
MVSLVPAVLFSYLTLFRPHFQAQLLLFHWLRAQPFDHEGAQNDESCGQHLLLSGPPLVHLGTLRG